MPLLGLPFPLCCLPGALGPRGPGQCPPTGCAPQVRRGDCFLLAFLSAEPPLPVLARGHLLSAGLGSLESRATSSGRWRDEWLLPRLRSCAWERRVAAMRAMLLVLKAISLRVAAAVLGVSSSGPAGEHSLETRLLILGEPDFCRKVTAAGSHAGPQKQTQGQ